MPDLMAIRIVPPELFVSAVRLPLRDQNQWQLRSILTEGAESMTITMRNDQTDQQWFNWFSVWLIGSEAVDI
jgi:hypothetical protein